MKVYVVFDTFDYIWGIYEAYDDAQKQANKIKFAYVEEINVVPSSSPSSTQCGSGIPGDWQEE